jgi:hypothetical protein
MFEWHGWATIVASPGVEDDAQAEARQRDAGQQGSTGHLRGQGDFE